MERSILCSGNDHLPKKGEERAWVSQRAETMVEEVKPWSDNQIENQSMHRQSQLKKKIRRFFVNFQSPSLPTYLMYRVVTATSRLKVNTRQGRSWKNDRYWLEFVQQCIKNVSRCIHRKLWNLNFHHRSGFKFRILWWYWFHCLPCKRYRKHEKM